MIQQSMLIRYKCDICGHFWAITTEFFNPMVSVCPKCSNGGISKYTSELLESCEVEKSLSPEEVDILSASMTPTKEEKGTYSDLTLSEIAELFEACGIEDDQVSKEESQTLIFTPEQVEAIRKLIAEEGLRNKMFDTIPYIPPSISPACVRCSNHPTNGGSGICHCTMGSTVSFR